MSFDNVIGPGPGKSCFPEYPYQPVPYAPAPTTNTFALSPAPPSEPKTSARIFTDIKKANKFMKKYIVVDVDIETYETETLEGIVITVFYEVEA